ncbi:MAG: dihydrolipoamide acetyltransferase family protein, partial [Acidimicrobiia bacterium]
MTLRFALPDVGEGLHEAEIVRWLVAVGETVARDQPIVEILTDKAQVELPSPAAGTIASVHAAEGDIVTVGTVIVDIDDGRGADAPPASPAPAVPSAASPAAAPSETTPVAAPAAATAPAVAAAPSRRPKASPSTRKLAARLGVDLRRLAGTGPGGRILAADVEAAHAGGPAPSAAPPATPAARTTPSTPAAAAAEPGPLGPVPTSRSVTTLGQLPAGTHPLRGIRRLTAASMAQSWTTIPHITGMDEVDATALLDARKRLQGSLRAGGAEEAAAALTPLVLLAAAVARTLRRFPLVNAAVDADGAAVTVHERVNLGVAVATPDGLIVPVVTDADRRDLVSLALEMQRLAVAARNRTVSADELRGGTFTLTNYGALGGRFATPLILPGQAGIMGFGAIKERPIVVDGAVVARRTLPVVFSADHR